jgi:hypothetical protein
MPTPDLAGFAEAELKLREQFGVDATFIIPGVDAWPADTPTDPETGKPYDPFLAPEVDNPDVQITLRCSYVHRPFTPGLWGGMDTPQTPLGVVDRGMAALILTAEQRNQVRGATRVVIGEETWDVELWRNDVQFNLDRWLVYLEHA